MKRSEMTELVMKAHSEGVFVEDVIEEAYQMGGVDMIEKISKAMHEAYKGTSNNWECMVFDLVVKNIKGEKNV